MQRYLPGTVWNTVLAVSVFDIRCNDIDRDLNMRKGVSMACLRAGLDHISAYLGIIDHRILKARQQKQWDDIFRKKR